MSSFRSTLMVIICAAAAAACTSNKTTTADGGTDAGNNDAGNNDAGNQDAGPVGDGGSAPGAPVLTFTTSATGVQLAWTLPGAFGDETFAVLRSDQGGPFNTVPDAGTVRADAYSDGVASALAGAGHNYEVKASNGNGTGPASNVVSVLQAPGDLIAAGSDTRVILLWSGIANASSYDLYKVDASGGSPTLVINTTTPEYVDTSSITTGSKYQYEVLAHPLDGGQLSTASNIAVTTALGIDVSRTITFVSDTDAGTASGTQGLSLIAMVPSDGGTLVEHDSVSNSTACVIPGVPTGPYYFTQGYLFNTLTSARTLNADQAQPGRTDLAQPMNLTSQTYVTYAMTGLDAWVTNDAGTSDTLNSISQGADNTVVGLEFDLNGYDGDAGIAAGGTTFNGAEDITGQFGDSNLLNSAEGDVYYLYQLHTKATAGGVPYQAVTKAYSSSSLTMVDDQATAIAGAMTAAPVTAVPDLVVKNSAFVAQKAGVNPIATNAGQSISIGAVKDFNLYGDYTAGVTLLSIATDGGTSTDVDLGAVSYGNPFPAAWEPFVSMLYGFNVDYDLADAGTPATFDALSNITRPAAGFDFTTGITPAFAPLTAVTINNKDAFTDQTNVGITPTFSWTPAATLGTPTYYIVTIYQLGIDADNDVQIGTPLFGSLQYFTFVTKGTSITIPATLPVQVGSFPILAAETMAESFWYFATIDAVEVKNGTTEIDPTVNIFAQGNLVNDIEIVTNKFTPGPGKAAPSAFGDFAVRASGAMRRTGVPAWMAHK